MPIKAFPHYTPPSRSKLVDKEEIKKVIKPEKDVIAMLQGKNSNERLDDLDFDPIEALLKQLEDVERLLAKEMADGDGRAMVITALVNNRTKIVEALLPYGYSKVPTAEVTTRDREPIRIIFHKEEEDE